MATGRGHELELRNETAINVVGLLKAGTGETRRYPLRLERFPLDEGLVAERVAGEVKLTRLRDAVLAWVRADGAVALECVRCLRTYDQAFAVDFSEEYLQTVDVRTGLGLILTADEDDETSQIDENHELDLGEVLRQEILLALPMRPDCGEACPGPDSLESMAIEPSEDDRLAALASLLDDGQP